jgi:hypothetical protein
LYVLNAALEVSIDFALPEILALLFRYLRDIAEIRLGSTHPAAEIARRFGALESAQHAHVLRLMRRLRADSKDGQQTSELAFSVYDRCVEVWSEGTENLVSGLQLMLSEWGLVQQSYIMTLWLRMRVAIVMLDQGRLGPVEEMLRSQYSRVVLQPKEPLRVSLILQCYKIRGYMYLEKGMLEKAETHFHNGVLLADATWGKHNEVSLGFVDDARAVLLLRRRGAREGGQLQVCSKGDT